MDIGEAVAVVLVALGSSTPCPGCTIASKARVTSPPNQARTRLGVGEEVELTMSPGSASWTITSGNGRLSPSKGTKSTFTATDQAGSVTITARGLHCTCSSTITFTVVEPSSWTMKRKSGTGLKHQLGRPDCGWRGTMFIHQDDVNFYKVLIREMDSQAIATGSYMVFNGVKHGNYPPPDHASPWFRIIGHTTTDGSEVALTDNIYSGDPGASATGTTPPFHVGTMYFPITMEWKVGTGHSHQFPVIRQEHEIFSDGKCESRKGSNMERTTYSDPTSTP